MIKFLAIIIGLFVATITTLALAPAISAIWSVPDQIAEQTNNKNFQSTYQTSKGIINTAEEADDKFAFAKGILALALIIGVPASIIKGFMK